jgi:twitching motility protein PilT
MALERFIQWAEEQGASDLHVECGLPAAVRVRGELRMTGERVGPDEVKGLVRELIPEAAMPELLERRSADLSRTIRGVRCRINVLHSARGVGLAIRLLRSPRATLERLNLHPGLARFAQASHGLVLVSGATGSGKTSTLAALLEGINTSEARHILTLESPIEYSLVPKRSFIRQREVGRDTPSFAQGLFDAMREDPDVLMVGEMREPEVMRLTLNAAETGHLVLATVHSSSVAEALHRMVSAFPAEAQPGVCAQLADCLVGVVAQQLHYREDLGMRIPECEVLVAGSAARAVIRSGQIFKLGTVIDSGAADGCFSFARYRDWLAAKSDWVRPADAKTDDDAEEPVPYPVELAPVRRPEPRPRPAVVERPKPADDHDDRVLVLDEEPEDLSALLRDLERRRS